MDNKANAFMTKIEQLNNNFDNSSILLLEDVFNKEQNIPKELMQIKSENQKWWCIKSNDEVVGIVAAWEINSEWHLGRLAIHKKLRGFGFGNELTKKALEELFRIGIEKVRIDARDIAVKIVLKQGGIKIGRRVNFYGPITPMEIHKKDFIQ